MKESPNTLVKMKKGPGRPKKSEAIIKDVKRRTKRLFNPEEKIAIVLEGLSGDESIAAICRREGIAQSVYYSWSKAFMDAGKTRRCILESLMVRTRNITKVLLLRMPL